MDDPFARPFDRPINRRKGNQKVFTPSTRFAQRLSERARRLYRGRLILQEVFTSAGD
jgi:hypothetical protein